jgi:hypothetical protein
MPPNAMGDRPSHLNLVDRTFRANPGYRLTLFDRLPLDQQQALAGLKEDPDLYGLLTAHNGSLRSKAVSQQTALLFLSLQHPGRLPFYVLDHAAADLEGSIAQLVSDGVLEVQVGDGFVSGTLAHELLFPSPTGEEEELGFLGRLSREAIRYGACLDGLGTTELSRRLYLYNRIPISGRWRSRIGSSDDVKQHWRIPRGIESLPGGDRWRFVDSGSDDWICWRQSGVPGMANERQATYKLYVSPMPDHVASSLAATVKVLINAGAPSLKIGGTLAGLLRPDKIVCYFDSFDQLSEAASELAAELDGVEAQGVPFTSELAGEGLISWGVDPASNEEAFGWLGRQSWRLWVTNHLAASLLAAGSGSVPAWRFALDRLSLEGVDPRTWAPRDLSRLAYAADESQGVGAWR